MAEKHVHKIDLTGSYEALQALHELSRIPVPVLAEMAVSDGVGPLGERLKRAFNLETPRAVPMPPRNAPDTSARAS